MHYRVTNDIITFIANTKGAEIVSLFCNGRERLWQNETGEWDGHAPALFPVCGNCAVRINGKDYPVKKHGFAKTGEFEVIERGDDFIAFRLESDEETKRVFPFDFAFTVRYRLCGSSVEIIYETENTGDEPLYFSCGGHESFAFESEVEHYEVRFEKQEKLVTLVHNDEGRLTGEERTLSEHGVLPLKAEYFQNGNTLIFGGIKSRRAALCERGGKWVAETEFEGFSNLLLWKPERTKMLCMEPWLNLPDRVGERKEFSAKGGVLCVEPQKTKRLIRKIRYD